MSTENITKKTCDWCKHTEQTINATYGGMPFRDWVELTYVPSHQGAIQHRIQKDFCSLNCLTLFCDENSIT